MLSRYVPQTFSSNPNISPSSSLTFCLLSLHSSSPLTKLPSIKLWIVFLSRNTARRLRRKMKLPWFALLITRMLVSVAAVKHLQRSAWLSAFANPPPPFFFLLPLTYRCFLQFSTFSLSSYIFLFVYADRHTHASTIK
jgi:hypothetical protein